MALTTSASKSAITSSIELLILVTAESKESSRSEILPSTTSIAFILSEISVLSEFDIVDNSEFMFDSKVEIVSWIAKSADCLSAASSSIEFSIPITAFRSASSLVKSIDCTKETTSANWSKSTVDPSSIASIRPFSTSILDWRTPSASYALAISVDKAAFNTFSCIVALASSLATASILAASSASTRPVTYPFVTNERSTKFSSKDGSEPTFTKPLKVRIPEAGAATVSFNDMLFSETTIDESSTPGIDSICATTSAKESMIGAFVFDMMSLILPSKPASAAILAAVSASIAACNNASAASALASSASTSAILAASSVESAAEKVADNEDNVALLERT